MSDRYTNNTNNSVRPLINTNVTSIARSINEVTFYTESSNSRPSNYSGNPRSYRQASRFRNNQNCNRNENENNNHRVPYEINKDIPLLDYQTTKNHFVREENFLGRGSYGDVYKSLYYELNEGDSVLAVAKICKYSNLDDENYFKHEINSLKILDHPNIIKIYGYCHKKDRDYSDKGEFIMILEYWAVLNRCANHMAMI